MMRVKNKPGRLIPKPPIGMFRPREQRFYNWGGRGEDGKLRIIDKSWDVPRDSYHGRLIVKGDLLLDDSPKEPPKKKPGRPKNEDNK